MASWSLKRIFEKTVSVETSWKFQVHKYIKHRKEAVSKSWINSIWKINLQLVLGKLLLYLITGTFLFPQILQGNYVHSMVFKLNLRKLNLYLNTPFSLSLSPFIQFENHYICSYMKHNWRLTHYRYLTLSFRKSETNASKQTISSIERYFFHNNLSEYSWEKLTDWLTDWQTDCQKHIRERQEEKWTLPYYST